MRERPPLDWHLLVALCAVTLDLALVIPRVPHVVPAPVPQAAIVESEYERLMDAVAVVLERADARYRAGDPAGAAELVRGLPTGGEHASLAELYEHLAASLAIALDDDADPIAAFEALARARSTDQALGGALADHLTRRMRVVAPRAAARYGATGDRAGAELAAHTAELAGAR